MASYPTNRRIYAGVTAVSEKALLPKCWLADLIHSQMATGNVAKMARDAIAKAQADKRNDDVTLYRNMLGQFCDYYAQGADV